METTHTTLDTPVGSLRLFATDTEGNESLVAILWGDEPLRKYLDGSVYTRAEENSAVLQTVCEQIMEYFRGQRMSFHVPLAPVGTAFQQKAWTALQEIPYGETRSYAAQAAHIGNPTAARAVGAANGQNPIPIIVPCHRVIGANGSLTGFAGGLDAKRWLLRHERRVSGISADGQLSMLD